MLTLRYFLGLRVYSLDDPTSIGARSLSGPMDLEIFRHKTGLFNVTLFMQCLLLLCNVVFSSNDIPVWVQTVDKSLLFSLLLCIINIELDNCYSLGLVRYYSETTYSIKCIDQ